MSAATKAAMKTRTIKNKVGDVVAEAEYVLKQATPTWRYWQLKRWRVSVAGDKGRWHRVNETGSNNPVAGFERSLDYEVLADGN